MDISDTGTKDITLRWPSLDPIPNIKDWVFFATPYEGIMISNKNIGVHALSYLGGTTLAGGSNENMRQQRPAL